MNFTGARVPVNCEKSLRERREVRYLGFLSGGRSFYRRRRVATRILARPTAGGACGDGASSTELLVVSRKETTKRYLGQLLMGRAGWAAAGLAQSAGGFPFFF
jgi:hypothetical protein